jgi:hypothetical protein
LQNNGVSDYHYILDHSKIVTKLRESGLGDMEEFSNIPEFAKVNLPQDNLPENKTTDIPIFNAPEIIIPPKIIPPQSEKNTPSPNTNKKDKKADKQDESIQALFDYVAEDTHAPVVSTSGTSETSKTAEPENDEPETINKVVNMSSKETPIDSPKAINQISSDILMARTQREERLRKKAVKLGEDPDAFVTITEKD